jgi:hypothetical protein
MDMRRSAAVEARAGDASAEAMATKLANSLDTNNSLWKTYLPVDPETVRQADHARLIGRRRLRANAKTTEKLKLGAKRF